MPGLATMSIKELEGKAFTVTMDRQTISLVSCVTFRMNDGRKVYTRAIWDTGASFCVMREQFAKGLTLYTVGEGEVYSAGVHRKSPIVEADMILPGNIEIKRQQFHVVKFAGLHFDVVIGMDIIRRGDFACCLVDGCTQFSFRVKSKEVFDFTKE